MPTNQLNYNPATDGSDNSKWINRVGAIIHDKSGNDIDSSNPLFTTTVDQDGTDATLNTVSGFRTNTPLGNGVTYDSTVLSLEKWTQVQTEMQQVRIFLGHLLFLILVVVVIKHFQLLRLLHS
jgi:hypothetical protein